MMLLIRRQDRLFQSKQLLRVTQMLMSSSGVTRRAVRRVTHIITVKTVHPVMNIHHDMSSARHLACSTVINGVPVKADESPHPGLFLMLSSSRQE